MYCEIFIEYQIVMLCEEKEVIYLFIVCVYGYDIILKNMKDINLCMKFFFLQFVKVDMLVLY